MLFRLSSAWARVELFVAALLALAITLLILLNVITRSMGNALFWVDELAIYAMAWMTFLGASAAIHHRNAVSITLLPESLPEHYQRLVHKSVDMIIFLFSLFMLWCCWLWFAPWDLAKTGFDIAAFQSASFNFVYAEPTTTLGVPKYFFWLAMWFFALGCTLHSTMHLVSPARVREASSS